MANNTVDNSNLYDDASSDEIKAQKGLDIICGLVSSFQKEMTLLLQSIDSSMLILVHDLYMDASSPEIKSMDAVLIKFLQNIVNSGGVAPNHYITNTKTALMATFYSMRTVEESGTKYDHRMLMGRMYFNDNDVHWHNQQETTDNHEYWRGLAILAATTIDSRKISCKQIKDFALWAGGQEKIELLVQLVERNEEFDVEVLESLMKEQNAIQVNLRYGFL